MARKLLGSPDFGKLRKMTVIDRAFITAAGMGKRLRPYTDSRPKPMVIAGDKTVIDHTIDRLEEAGVTQITVNLHYMADMLQQHLEKREHPAFVFSHETELLDTGGGVRKALASMGEGPFFVVSGDSLLLDGPSGSALRRMAESWDDSKMEMLLLLQPVNRMVLTEGVGDYDLDKAGRCIRSPAKTGAYMWTSVRICSKAIFNNTPEGAFSFLTLMDRAQQKGRLYGLVHDGEWHHISTPAELERVHESMKGRSAQKETV